MTIFISVLFILVYILGVLTPFFIFKTLDKFKEFFYVADNNKNLQNKDSSNLSEEKDNFTNITNISQEIMDEWMNGEKKGADIDE